MPQSQDFQRILVQYAIIKIVMNAVEVKTPDASHRSIERSHADARLGRDEFESAG
jgi:hypothetical protein